MLYIVVHHRLDMDQTYDNSWLDDELLEAITTTVEIGQFCQVAMERHERIYVHRCGWGDIRPTICCSLSVVSVDPLDRHTKLVRFAQQQVMGENPPRRPLHGESFYIV